MSQDDFDRLLQWFASDRNIAAKKYLETHERLTRLFYFKGCNRPEDLADEVMDRVAKKLPFPEPLSLDHLAVLVGFAHFVFHEYWRETALVGKESDPGEDPADTSENALKEMRARCLDGCLARIGKDDRQLLVEYHEYEKGWKIEHRKAMAVARHITLNALRLKACRLKSVVGECVKRCCQTGGIAEVQ